MLAKGDSALRRSAIETAFAFVRYGDQIIYPSGCRTDPWPDDLRKSVCHPQIISKISSILEDERSYVQGSVLDAIIGLAQYGKPFLRFDPRLLIAYVRRNTRINLPN